MEGSRRAVVGGEGRVHERAAVVMARAGPAAVAVVMVRDRREAVEGGGEVARVGAGVEEVAEVVAVGAGGVVVARVVVVGHGAALAGVPVDEKF